MTEAAVPYTCLARGRYGPHFLGLRLIGLRAIFVGFCHRRWKWPDRQLAHAHGDTICFRDGRYILAGKGVPHEVLLHEYAHILAGADAGHDELWQMTARRLGVPARDWYDSPYWGWNLFLTLEDVLANAHVLDVPAYGIQITADSFKDVVIEGNVIVNAATSESDRGEDPDTV